MANKQGTSSLYYIKCVASGRGEVDNRKDVVTHRMYFREVLIMHFGSLIVKSQALTLSGYIAKQTSHSQIRLIHVADLKKNMQKYLIFSFLNVISTYQCFDGKPVGH